MKQRILAIVLLAALLTLPVGCGAKAAEQSPYAEGDFDTSGDVVLRIEHPVYDKSVSSFRCYVENHTDRELTFGAPYEIEVQREGVWQKLPPAEDAAWNSIAYSLAPGEEWSNSFSFFAYDYEVSDGRYRLIKEIGGKRYAAEFTVGESEITGEEPFGYAALEDLPGELDPDTMEYDLRINAAGELCGGSEERVIAFLDSVARGSSAMLRIVCEGPGGGTVLYDLIYRDDHFLCRRDATRSSAVTAIEEYRYAFLASDGECVYLSDTVSLNEDDLGGRKITGGRYVMLQKNWFSDWDAILCRVEEMRRARLEGSAVLARYWSPDGAYWLELTGEKMDYLVSRKGYGMGRTLSECSGGTNMEIVSVRWESGKQVRLLCEDENSAAENSREPGWYAVFDVEAEKVVSSGRSMWVTGYGVAGIIQ